MSVKLKTALIPQVIGPLKYYDCTNWSHTSKF